METQYLSPRVTLATDAVSHDEVIRWIVELESRLLGTAQATSISEVSTLGRSFSRAVLVLR